MQIQPRKYQLSKSISEVHEIKFGDNAVICKYKQFAILILIGRLRCFKEAKLMDIILDE